MSRMLSNTSMPLPRFRLPGFVIHTRPATLPQACPVSMVAWSMNCCLVWSNVAATLDSGATRLHSCPGAARLSAFAPRSTINRRDEQNAAWSSGSISQALHGVQQLRSL